MQPRFFRSATDLRRWLEQHAADSAELLVGFYKVPVRGTRHDGAVSNAPVTKRA